MTEKNSGLTPSRRTLVRGAAWSVPVVAVATAAPAMAATLRMDPGINGWVLNTASPSGCNHSLTVDSNRPGTGPDGAPFGLYIYDTNDDDVITNATMTYWIEGTHTGVTWSTLTGHSPCWSYQGSVGTEVKPDGITYTGYRWNYTCAIDPTDRTLGSDGVERVFLGHFRVRSSNFSTPGRCGTAPTYWTQRAITITTVENGTEIFTFQRRNGRRGAYSGGSDRVAPQSAPVDTSALDAQIADLDVKIADLEAQIAQAQAQPQAAPEPSVDDAAVTAAPGESPVSDVEPQTAPDTSHLEATRDQLVAERSVLEQERAALLAQGETEQAPEPAVPGLT